MSKTQIKFQLNNQAVTVDCYPMQRLIDVLREEFELTGTKEGCGEGECGACGVFVEGELVNSCLIPAAQIEGQHVKTIEGLSETPICQSVQKSFLENGGAQCGICTPGMVMASTALLQKKPKPTDSEISEAISGNLCRCTGYKKILESIATAARQT